MMSVILVNLASMDCILSSVFIINQPVNRWSLGKYQIDWTFRSSFLENFYCPWYVPELPFSTMGPRTVFSTPKSREILPQTACNTSMEQKLWKNLFPVFRTAVKEILAPFMMDGNLQIFLEETTEKLSRMLHPKLKYFKRISKHYSTVHVTYLNFVQYFTQRNLNRNL